MHIVLSCIVPERWGGVGQQAIFIDTDLHLQAPRIASMLRQWYQQVLHNASVCKSNQPLTASIDRFNQPTNQPNRCTVAV
jgi:hypothetical protein